MKPAFDSAALSCLILRGIVFLTTMIIWLCRFVQSLVAGSLQSLLTEFIAF
jgi:hypothetical protein